MFEFYFCRTVHMSTANLTDLVRISCDTRYVVFILDYWPSIIVFLKPTYIAYRSSLKPFRGLSFCLFPSRWQPANEPADPRYVGEMRKPMLKFGLHADDGAPPQSVTMEQLRETWGLQWTNGCVIQNMMWYCDKCCKSLSVKVK